MKYHGFTLIELMVTLAIAAIVLTIGVPSFQSVIQSNRRVAVANDFIAALAVTRSEAIKRSKRVTLCKSSDQTACSTGTSVGYDKGWIIFEDNGATIGSIDSGEVIIRVFEGFPTGSVTLTSTSAVSNYVSYLSNGRVDNSGIVCTATGGCPFIVTAGSESKTISLSSTGRVNSN